MSWDALRGVATIVFLVTLFIGGFYGLCITNRRAFNRTNHAGVQQFSSYGKMLTTRFSEIIIRLLSILAIVFGGLMLLMVFFH